MFEPGKLVREARRQLGLPPGDVSAVVVLDPDGDLLRHVRGRRNVEQIAQWCCYHSSRWGTALGGVTAGVVPFVVGGPFAVLVAEQAFASGCRLLIDLTSAGRVTELEQAPPYFVVVEKAWRDEGTSLHYLPPSPWAGADPALLVGLNELAATAGGHPFLRGASWTTDAAYRGTPDSLAAAQHAGILAVEMEAASLYAFPMARQRTPRMSAIAERWIEGCRRELLDGTPRVAPPPSAADLARVRDPPQSASAAALLHGAAPLKPLPEPVDLDQYRVRRHARVGGLINQYRLVAHHGRGFRHPHPRLPSASLSFIVD